MGLWSVEGFQGLGVFRVCFFRLVHGGFRFRTLRRVQARSRTGFNECRVGQLRFGGSRIGLGFLWDF